MKLMWIHKLVWKENDCNQTLSHNVLISSDSHLHPEHKADVALTRLPKVLACETTTRNNPASWVYSNCRCGFPALWPSHCRHQPAWRVWEMTWRPKQMHLWLIMSICQCQQIRPHRRCKGRDHPDGISQLRFRFTWGGGALYLEKTSCFW